MQKSTPSAKRKVVAWLRGHQPEVFTFEIGGDFSESKYY